MAKHAAPWRPVPIMAILLLGTFLRCAMLDQNRAMEDEALYGYWGLQIASGSDPMLDREPVDKPPLFPYTLALTLAILGPVRPQAVSLPAPEPHTPIVGGPLACVSTGCRAEIRQIETESRLPSLFASIVTIALLYSLGTRLYKSASTGLLAALLVAVSPFAVSFGPTAFVDPLLTTWILGALLAASSGHLGVAGVMAGLAAATKQQGLLFLPLVLFSGASALHRVPGPRRQGHRWMPWLLFLVGFGAVIGGMGAWDQARDQRPGFFEQSVISYGGLRFAPLSELGDRARSWLQLAEDFWPSPWLKGLFLSALAALACAAGLAGLRRRGAAPSLNTRSVLGHTHDLSARSLAILLFIVLFLLAHWLLEIQLWDRYLLIILPLVALLVARALVSAGHLLPTGRWRAAGLPCVVIVVLVGSASPVLASLRGHLPIGGDHGAYDGMDDLAAYAREQLPAGSVLYDHWLGYHYRLYLYGAPLHIHWYPGTPDLVQDALSYRREPRYIVFPSWKDGSPAVVALAGAGISLAAVYETPRRDNSISFRLYRLVGP